MNEQQGYGDAEAKRIIERAAQIEAEQANRLDAPALREIAAEAGISSVAVDRALEEHHSMVPTRVPWLKQHRTMITIAAALAALLIVLVLARG